MKMRCAKKYPRADVVFPRLSQLQRAGLLQKIEGQWSLTERGQLLSNKVFEELTFSEDELTLLSADPYCSHHERKRGKVQPHA